LKWQLALFSLFSLIYLATLRRYVKSVFFGDTAGNDPLDDGITGRLGEVVAATAHGTPGRVRVGDAEWDAVSVEPLAAGAKVKVISRNNLTLTVEAAG
jgi:membrane protein implicated in regulation of membrane protease activity